MIQDNLYIVRRLVHTLKENDLFEGEMTQVQYTLRQMWAVISVMLGCVAEGSIWLTVMDSLLEDLASLLVGHVDPRLDTYKMEELRELLKSRPFADSKALYFKPMEITEETIAAGQFDHLKRNDQARLLFAEIARFFRGAVILSYVSVSWGHGIRKTNPSSRWFGELLKWSNTCESENCIEPLKVFMEDRGAMREYGLSVGIKDARLGHPQERHVHSHILSSSHTNSRSSQV